MTDSRAVEDVLGELGEADELLLELAGALLELGDAGVLLRHDVGGGVRNEALVLELAADFEKFKERAVRDRGSVPSHESESLLAQNNQREG